MKQIEINSQETDLNVIISIKDNWDEVTLSEYLKLVDVIDSKDMYEDEQFFIKMLTVITDQSEETLMEVPVKEFDKFIEPFNTFSTLEIPDRAVEHFDINGITYVPKKDMSNLTTSEVIYIKSIQKSSDKTSDIYLGMLAILLRPGFKRLEEGKERWIQYKLVSDDIDERKAIFSEHLSATIAMPLIKSFIYGTKE